MYIVDSSNAQFSYDNLKKLEDSKPRIIESVRAQNVMDPRQ